MNFRITIEKMLAEITPTYINLKKTKKNFLNNPNSKNKDDYIKLCMIFISQMKIVNSIVQFNVKENGNNIQFYKNMYKQMKNFISEKV